VKTALALLCLSTLALVTVASAQTQAQTAAGTKPHVGEGWHELGRVHVRDNAEKDLAFLKDGDDVVAVRVCAKAMPFGCAMLSCGCPATSVRSFGCRWFLARASARTPSMCRAVRSGSLTLLWNMKRCPSVRKALTCPSMANRKMLVDAPVLIAPIASA